MYRNDPKQSGTTPWIDGKIQLPVDRCWREYVRIAYVPPAKMERIGESPQEVLPVSRRSIHRCYRGRGHSGFCFYRDDNGTTHTVRWVPGGGILEKKPT